MSTFTHFLSVAVVFRGKIRGMKKYAQPEKIRAARQAAGLSQEQAAGIVGKTRHQTWQEWESGRKPMSYAMFELFCLKTQQNPDDIASTENVRE
ncbi:MAG: helix-turn-helix domain-containing protein [Zoogloeaceae bacterium]|jgi:DNA-binding transcriptional regulator YiaG|nr:helix-turn-helix domain-containing protein [Zoogloeaceae bacterium]